MFRSLMIAGALALGPMAAGCSTANYAIQERFGIEKRDILVSRVEAVATEQADAQAEFADALDAFRAVVAVDGGELERVYDDLSAAFDDAEGQANAVRDRVASVKQVSNDLFREWEGELSEYSDAGLQRSSERQLRTTRARSAELERAMDAATRSMDPVLAVFGDRVLFLKHNLNARAIASLDAETAELEGDVARLIAEMERSIAAADAFIAEMGAG